MASIFEGAISLDEFMVPHFLGLVDDRFVNDQLVRDVIRWPKSIVESGSYREHLQFIEPSISEEVRSVSQKCDMEKRGEAVVFQLL